MIRTKLLPALLVSTALVGPAFPETHVHATDGIAISLSPIGQYRTGIYLKSAAEIVTYDPASKRAFVINAASGEVDVLDLSDPSNPVLAFTLDVSDLGADANSVATRGGIVAVAVEAAVRTDPGFVAFYDTEGNRLSVVAAGALPDALTFSPDGRWVLVANEGEPAEDYAIDPEGSVTIIDLAGGAANLTAENVRTADFSAFNGREDELRAAGVRIFGPGASAAQDFEPEWVEVASDNRTAYVSLQENNAIAVVDIETATVTAVWPLGFKDWSENGPWSGNGFDASRRGAVDIRHWPVFGIYHPDTIRLYEVNGETFILGANEGDAREYDVEGWWSEEFAIRNLRLDPAAFPDAAALQAREAMGDLLVTSTLGFTNCDPSLSTLQVQELGFTDIRAYVETECLYTALYTYGGRSFGIWRVTDEGLEHVWDSGSQMEETILALIPEYFNADHRHRDEQLKRRSVNKGPEPEGIAVGEIGGRVYAFVGLERIGGVMVYDITAPAETSFVKYINTRDFSVATTTEGATDTDLGAEGLHFVPASDSPDAQGRPILLVGNEVSGTTRIFAIDQQ
ncbi:MAG: choice-of-anchor I family protein [Roseinatronobacter sp.]|jgi:DNA-binding beta-propeller fold protein YncE|nr:choice-of-anchor I family protein [Roseinatronobacter sp.]